MHRFLKYFGLIFIFAIICLLLAPLFIPLSKYKEMVTIKVKEITGRELEINGPIKLSLLPIPEIKVEDIKLSSLAGAHNHSLFEAKELVVTLSLSSFITGNIVISGIKIAGSVINLERLPNGLTSWELSRTLVNADTPAKKPDVGSSSQKEQIYINSVKVIETKINYLDSTKPGSNLSSLDIDNLEIKNLRGPNNLACEFYSTGKNYKINGSIEEDKNIIFLKTKLDLLGEEANISGNFNRNSMSFVGKLQLEGNAQNLKAMGLNTDIQSDLAHKLTFNINADKKLIKLTDVNITVGAMSARGNSNYDISANKADLSLKFNPNNRIFSFSTNLSYLDNGLLLKDTALIIDKANLNGNLGIKNWDKDLTISYDIQTNNLRSLANLFDFDLPASIDDLQIKGETIRVREKDQFKTNTVLALAKTTNLIKGEVILGSSPKTSLTLVSSGNNLGQTIGQLLKSTPSTLLGNYSLSAKIEGDLKKTIEINIDKSSFLIKNTPLNASGLLSLNLANSKPKILANLNISSLNIDNLSPNSPTINTTTRSTLPSSFAPWSNDKIDLSFLNKIDGDINLTIQKIIKGELVFDNIKTAIELTNGVLDLKSLSGNLYGGHLEASGQISAQNGQVATLKANLKGADLKNMTSQREKIKVTQGKINFDADLKTKGHSQYQYVSNLFGNTKLIATNGKISGFDLQKLVDSLKNIKSLDNVLKMLSSSFANGETSFKQLELATNIQDGIANITQFKLDVPSVEISASGNINLPKYTMNINSGVKVDIKSMPELKLYIRGSIDNPERNLDTKALREHLVKNVLTNLIDDVKKSKKPEDMLKNIIGGIIK